MKLVAQEECCANEQMPVHPAAVGCYIEGMRKSGKSVAAFAYPDQGQIGFVDVLKGSPQAEIHTLELLYALRPGSLVEAQ
jgi:hypothetical protein